MPELASVEFDRLDDQTLLVRLSGELDLANLGDVRRQIEQELGGESVSLMVDLTGIAFLDSSAVQLLFRLRDALESRQMRLAVVIPPTALIRRALAIADGTSLLDVVGSVEEAQSLLARGEGGN